MQQISETAGFARLVALARRHQLMPANHSHKASDGELDRTHVVGKDAQVCVSAGSDDASDKESEGDGVAHGLDLGSRKLRPDFAPVIWTEVAASEFAPALFLDASTVRNRDAAAPLVYGGPRLSEAPGQRGLKAFPVKEGGPIAHAASMAEPYSKRQAGYGTTILLFWHEPALPYAQAMTAKTASVGTNTASFGFGARLKAAREKVGMTGSDLGKGAGERGKDASKASVSDWEHERHYPKADQLRVICLKLNISVDELIFGDVQAQANLIFAESAIKALTQEQRMALLAKMMGPAVPDEHVEKHLRAPPPVKHSKREAFLPAAKEASQRHKKGG